MLQPQQLQAVSLRYAPQIAELRAFFASSEIPLSMAHSLTAVDERLRHDRSFRRDLTSHLWVVLHGGGRQMTFADVLGIVACAVAGERLAAQAGEAETHRLLRFLMDARSGFEASGGDPAPAAAGVAVMPLPALASTPPPLSAPLLSAMVPEGENHRRPILWAGAALCALVLLLGAVWLHRSPSPAPITMSATQNATAVNPQSDTTNLTAATPSAGRPQTQGSLQTQAMHFTQRSARAGRPAAYRGAPAASAPPADHDVTAGALPLKAATGTREVSPVRHAHSPRKTPTSPATSPALAATREGVPAVAAVDLSNRSAAAYDHAISTAVRAPTVRPTSLGIMAANVTYSPSPAYPPAATAARVQGEVKLEAEVDRDGNVTSTRIISGPPLLRGATEDAVQHWRYRPYLYDGKPVAMNTTVIVDYQLP